MHKQRCRLPLCRLRRWAVTGLGSVTVSESRLRLRRRDEQLSPFLFPRATWSPAQQKRRGESRLKVAAAKIWRAPPSSGVPAVCAGAGLGSFGHEAVVAARGGETQEQAAAAAQMQSALPPRPRPLTTYPLWT